MSWITCFVPSEATGLFWVGVVTLVMIGALGLLLLQTLRVASSRAAESQARQLDALEAVLEHAKSLGKRTQALDETAANYGQTFGERLDAHAAQTSVLLKELFSQQMARGLEEISTTCREQLESAERGLKAALVEHRRGLETAQQDLETASKERRDADKQAVDALFARTANLIQAMEKSGSKHADSLAAVGEALLDGQRCGLQAMTKEHQSQLAVLSELSQRVDAWTAEQRSELSESALELRTGAEALAHRVEELSTTMLRYREAQERQISALKHVDQGILQAGQGAARDVLEQFLTRTHQLFDQQLDLQEQLIARLSPQAVVGVDALDELVGDDIVAEREAPEQTSVGTTQAASQTPAGVAAMAGA